MKSTIVSVFVLSILLTSCTTGIPNGHTGKGTADSTQQDSLKTKKFVKALVPGNDTSINYIDEKGHKQGHWIITNNTTHLPGYGDRAKVEEGYYKDGKKEGEWTEYNADGSTRSKVIYKDDSLVKK